MHDAYRGGLVVTDRAAIGKLGLVGDSGTDAANSLTELVAAMAVGCRQRFASDYGLAVGPFPPAAPAGSEPQPVFYALASAAGVEHTKCIPFAGHPATLRIYCAKHALNFARLALLPGG